MYCEEGGPGLVLGARDGHRYCGIVEFQAAEASAPEDSVVGVSGAEVRSWGEVPSPFVSFLLLDCEFHV